MERGLINDIPVWCRMVSFGGNERTVIKEAPGVDGAVVETQGQAPQRFTLEVSLIFDGVWIVDDIEGATLDFRAMLLAGGPFTVQIPYFGELTDLWLASPYQVQYYDETKIGFTSTSLELVQAEQYLVLTTDAWTLVDDTLAELSKAAGQDFGRRAPDIGFSDPAIAALQAAAAWLSDVQGDIFNALQTVNDYAAAINNLNANLEALLGAPQNFASQLISTAGGLLSLVPSLSAQGNTDTGSAAVQDATSDTPKNVLVNALEAGAAFDTELAPTQAEQLGDEASEEDLAELDEVNSAKSLALVSMASGVCLAASSTTFATIESVLELADAMAPLFAKLLELDGIDYLVFSSARTLWKATLSLLADQAASLPRLVTITVGQDTDVLTLLADIYDLTSEDEVQLAVDSICSLNALYDPTNIAAGTEVRYLYPLVE